jgi:hypothetical protein
MAKTQRLIKASTGAALSLALVLVSPGLECYAGAGASLNTPVSDVGSPTTGKTGNSGVSLIQVQPGSLQLSPASLSGTLNVMSAVPTVVETGKVAPISLPSAMPEAAASQTGQIALTATPFSLSAPIRLAAPEAAQGSQADAPAQTISAQSSLQKGVKELSEAKGTSGRQQVLDTVFTNAKAKTDDADVAAPQAQSDSAFSSLLQPSAPELVRANTVPQAESSQALAKTRIFITRAGQDPVATSLADLPKALAAEPALKESLNKMGRIRVVLSRSNPQGGLAKTDVTQLQQVLSGYGVTSKIEVENIPIDWNKDAPAAAPGPETAAAPQKAASNRNWLQRYIIGPVTRPFRELAYLGRTIAASYTTPTMRELILGVTMKLVIPLVVLKQIGWIAMYNGHPVAKALALGLSLGLQVFHGIFVGTWSNLQNNIGKQRGVNYQTSFNLLYGQWWGALFRTIAWSAIPKTVPPWSYKYWKDMGIQTVAGTFFGTLGYQGLNTLYNNGLLSQGQRSFIFLVRDLIMTLAGTLFGSGSMAIFWGVFIAQQLMDLGIYSFSRSRWATRRPILYVADDMVAATPEFQGMYPVQAGAVEQESPLKQALKNILSVPLLKPIVWAAKKVYGLLKSQKATPPPSTQGQQVLGRDQVRYGEAD